MGLYERLFEERAEEELRLGGALPRMRGLDLKVLGMRLEGSKGHPGYAADLSIMHRLIKKGPRNDGVGMRLWSLKAKYREEYGELRAERQGQQELLQGQTLCPEFHSLLIALVNCSRWHYRQILDWGLTRVVRGATIN